MTVYYHDGYVAKWFAADKCWRLTGNDVVATWYSDTNLTWTSGPIPADILESWLRDRPLTGPIKETRNG